MKFLKALLILLATLLFFFYLTLAFVCNAQASETAVASWYVDSWYNQAYNDKKGEFYGKVEDHTIGKGLRRERRWKGKADIKKKVQTEKNGSHADFNKRVRKRNDSSQWGLSKAENSSSDDGGVSGDRSSTSKPHKWQEIGQSNKKPRALYGKAKHKSCNSRLGNNCPSKRGKSPIGKTHKRTGQRDKESKRTSETYRRKVWGSSSDDFGDKDTTRTSYGLASYYDSKSACGPKTNNLKGCPTASGKSIYELEKNKTLFCASNDFPIGTRLEICSANTRRCTRATVLDRGGFKRYGRSLDLGRLAFSKIDSIRRGLTEVTITEIKK